MADIDVDFNNIKLGEFIASGSYGEVYKACWKNKEQVKEIVVKKLRPLTPNGTEAEKNSLKRETDNLKTLKHRHIVKFYGLSKDDANYIYMLFEYADCGSLYKFLHVTKHQITAVGKLNWMLQIAQGMMYLHSMKIVHRDLKTQNILLFNNYFLLKICDFGTVKVLETINTNFTGTIGYMAPEVGIGKVYTEKCDVFSFGIVFWEVMARLKPFDHLREMVPLAIQRKITDDNERPDINKVNYKESNKYYKPLIEKCWDKDPEKRPSMAALASILSIEPRVYADNPTFLDFILRALGSLRVLQEKDFRLE